MPDLRRAVRRPRRRSTTRRSRRSATSSSARSRRRSPAASGRRSSSPRSSPRSRSRSRCSSGGGRRVSARRIPRRSRSSPRSCSARCVLVVVELANGAAGPVSPTIARPCQPRAPFTGGGLSGAVQRVVLEGPRRRRVQAGDDPRGARALAQPGHDRHGAGTSRRSRSRSAPGSNERDRRGAAPGRTSRPSSCRPARARREDADRQADPGRRQPSGT